MTDHIVPKFRESVKEPVNEAFDRAFDGVRTVLVAELRKAANNSIQQSCLNCILFKEKTEQCNLYKARPPARVIAFGCKDYLDHDEIPF